MMLLIVRSNGIFQLLPSEYNIYCDCEGTLKFKILDYNVEAIDHNKRCKVKKNIYTCLFPIKIYGSLVFTKQDGSDITDQDITIIKEYLNNKKESKNGNCNLI